MKHHLFELQERYKDVIDLINALKKLMPNWKQLKINENLINETKIGRAIGSSLDVAPISTPLSQPIKVRELYVRTDPHEQIILFRLLWAALLASIMSLRVSNSNCPDQVFNWEYFLTNPWRKPTEEEWSIECRGNFEEHGGMSGAI